MQLSAGRVGLEPHPRVLALARHVARGLGDHPRGARPAGPGAAPAILEVAGEGGGPPDAGGPHREDGVALGPAEQHARPRLGDRHHVALERGRRVEVDAGGDGRGRAASDAEVLLDEGRARGEDRLLGKDRGQARRVLDQVEAPVADAREHLELGHVGAAAERDHAGGDAAAEGALDLGAAAGHALGVGAVGEEQQVLEVDLLPVEREVAGVERDVDVDAAAAHAHAADGLVDGGLVDDRSERDAPVDGGVDVLHAEEIPRPEQRGRSRGGLVGQLELGVAGDLGPHRARDVDPDHLGEAPAPLLLLEVERDRRHLLDGRARVAARAQAPVAAHEHQAAAEIAHVAGQGVDLPGGEVGGADVGEDDDIVGGEPAQVGGDGGGAALVDPEGALRERLGDEGALARVALEHQRGGLPAHAHERAAGVVLGRLVEAWIHRGHLDVVAVEAGARRLLPDADHVLPGGDLRAGAGDGLAVAAQADLHVGRQGRGGDEA